MSLSTLHVRAEIPKFPASEYNSDIVHQCSGTTMLCLTGVWLVWLTNILDLIVLGWPN